MKTFEQFLQERCPSERHTNNSLEGFDSWLEEQDVADIMEYAEFYGKFCFIDGEKSMANELKDRLKINY
jgi:hypothetical protein